MNVFVEVEKKINEELLKKYIIDVPDFPKPGIVFKDVTPLFENMESFNEINDRLSHAAEVSGAEKIIGIDARGFVVGAAITGKLGKGLILARKPGKLPRKTVSQEYDLEYGTNTLEITEGSIKPGEKVFIVDDLLATGGTAEAVLKIALKMGAEVVGIGFIIELGFLNGREKLKDVPVVSLVKY